MTATCSARLILNEGCVRIDVPDKFKRSVPNKYSVEAIQEPTGAKIYCIVRQAKWSKDIKHVDLVLTDEDFSLSDREFKDRFVTPACSMLGGV